MCRIPLAQPPGTPIISNRLYRRGPAAYLDNAQFALQEGRVTEAILDSEKALALSTSGSRWSAEQKRDVDLKTHEIMARAYEAREDWLGTRSQLSTLLTRDPKNQQA